MTKQEYEAKYAECNNWLGNIRVCRQYISSLEAENASLTLLYTQATDEMLKMQNRVHELEAEVANLNDWLTAWKESFTLAQAEIAKLKAQEEEK